MNSIFARRSIRKYTKQRVPEEDVKELLRAAMAAPSANNRQPWHFVVIRDRSVLEEITFIHPYAQMLKEASLAIVVCGEEGIGDPNVYWVQDCSAATQNILLMAQEKGLGAVWLGVYPRNDRVEGVRKLLKIPRGIVPLCIVSVGYPAEKKEPANRYDDSKIHYEKW